jgi:hypothetical protein
VEPKTASITQGLGPELSCICRFYIFGASKGWTIAYGIGRNETSYRMFLRLAPTLLTPVEFRPCHTCRQVKIDYSNIMYSSVSGKDYVSPIPSLTSHRSNPINAYSPCLIDRSVVPIRNSFSRSVVHFLPLFLIPWDPVLRGPLLAPAFFASSALALASARLNQ